MSRNLKAINGDTVISLTVDGQAANPTPHHPQGQATNHDGHGLETGLDRLADVPVWMHSSTLKQITVVDNHHHHHHISAGTGVGKASEFVRIRNGFEPGKRIRSNLHEDPGESARRLLVSARKDQSAVSHAEFA